MSSIIALIADLLKKQPVVIITAGLHLLLAIVFLAGIWIDDRQVLGVSVWLKPFKFACSIFLYLFTIAIFLSYLPVPSRLASLVGLIVSVSMLIEIGLIGMQAFRGVTSHFNFSTPFDGAVFQVMGGVILINTLAVALLLIRYIVDPPFLAPSYLLGIRLGLLVFIAGSLQGVAMVSLASHTVGAPDGGPGLPLVNWSTKAGDLRVGHFVGLHALQLIPLTGWLSSGGNNPERCTGVSMLWVWSVAGLVTGLMIWTTVQALVGKPLISAK